MRGAQTRGDRPGSVWRWSVGLLAAVLGANLATPPLVGAALARPLRTALGTNQVDVAVESWPPPALWWGRVDHMTVHARDVATGDLRFEGFSASFRGLRIDPGALYAHGSLVVRGLQSGIAQAALGQEALAGALARQRGVRIDALVLKRDGVTVRGAMQVLGTDIAVEGDGRLVLNGPDAIDLILNRATVAGAASSAMLKGRLAARVPSVLRVPPLPLGLRLTGLHMEDGRLLLDASTGQL
jgi:LmeA-like phospholipid-binding